MLTGRVPFRSLAFRLAVVAFLLAILSPLAAAQADVNGIADGKPDPSGFRPGDALNDGLGSLGITPGIAITLGVIGLVGVSAALAWSMGTKFVNADNVLDNEARRSIFEYIQAHPGTHLRATAGALTLSTTNVLWHLRKLEDAKLISSKKFEGYKLFYPVAGGVESKRRAVAMAVLRNDNATQILEYVLATPSAHQREIARALGVNHGTIRWHLRKLTEAGLVLEVKKEHTSQYYVSELGVQLLGERNGTRPAGGPLPPPPEHVIRREQAEAHGGSAPAESGAPSHEAPTPFAKPALAARPAHHEAEN